MKQLWLLPILIVEIALLGYALCAKATDYLIKWDPVCRHNAIYWASVVDEQFPVRFVFGKMYETPIPKGLKDFAKEQKPYTWHVQPQVKLTDNWYYFKVENNIVMIITMPDYWKKEYIMYKADYVDYLFHIDRGKKLTVCNYE